MVEVTVGVDIGTTSVKAVAADAEGNVVARARVPHQVRFPAPKRIEHDADAAWRDGVRQAHEQVSAGQRVAAVQVAAMVPSMCAVDAAGHALTAGLLYGDERSGEAGGADPSGGRELAGFAQWCAQQAPGAAGLWPAQAMATHALGGTAAIDTITAMMATPLFTGQGWDAEVCKDIGVRPEQLPAIVPTGQPAGRVGGVPLGAGTIDVFTEQLCAGAVHDGDVLVICGTTLIVWVVTPEAVEVPGLFTAPGLAPGKWIVGGPSNAGGLFLEWTKRLLGLEAVASAADPGRVPVWLPYVRGERSPLHDPGRRAVLADLDLTHGPAELRRAAYEAAGFVVRHHIDLASQPVRRIVATGGGVRDTEWMQALADATGLPVDVVAVPEGAALGAAFVARVVAGLEPDASGAARWARAGARVEPRSAWTGPAADRYRRFRELAGG